MDVWAAPKMDPVPSEGFPGYAGWAGPYDLAAEAVTPTASSITIKTPATTTYWGRTVALNGAITPVGLVGYNIVAGMMGGIKLNIED